MPKNSMLENRIKSEQEAAMPIKAKNLVCKDCVFRLNDEVKIGNVSKCAVYESKPNKVLLGGSCNDYIKE